MRQKQWFFLICALWITLISTNANAIPAFARRYKISCTTCHTPFPKLKEYGNEFAADGMILKEEEKERDYISAGDDLLWLNRTLPVAIRFDAFGVYEPDSEVKTDLESPWGLKLLSGGALYKNIGYYFYFYMYERGEVSGIEDAYIHFNNLFGSNLDILVGQFQTCDPLMKRELRLTFEDYMIYGLHIGDSRANLTYDRGIMALYSFDKTGTELVGMVVNGNGKPMADEDTKKFDSDSHKNYGLRLKQKLLKHISVGGFYYLGKETLTAEDNEITYWGPDLNVHAGPIEVTAQYLEREDTNPLFINQGTVKTTGTVVEAIYSPKLDKSRWFLTALYNNIESDMDVYNYETATLSGTFLVARNLRFTIEYTRDILYDKNRMVFGMVTGF